MKKHKQISRDMDKYSAEYIKHYGFEQVQVAYRRQVLIEQLLALRPNVVLEIGCGTELLYEHYLKLAAPVKSWIVVEPARQFAQKACEAALPGMKVIEGFTEESLPLIQSALPQSPEFVICAGVLQEVPSAASLLNAIRAIMDQNSVLHVNVPNAASFHRRLALSMGLIPTLDTMSESNILMQQRCVYDIESLTSDLHDAGFTIIGQGGFFIKPFTQLQMQSIVPLLGNDVLDGLFEMGKNLPELASEIYVNARTLM